MTLACQKDSYLKEFKTKVKTCKETETYILTDGKKNKIQGLEIVLEDTILFPEGGGQSDDRGTINGFSVLKVTRNNKEVIHLVKKNENENLGEGEEAEVKVDWKRRWDNMQQHSGQHLISALALNSFGFNTTSWNLGEQISFIELDTNSISEKQMEELESECNQRIREALEVKVTWIDDKNSDKVKEIKSRGLKMEEMENLRVVSIQGVDENMCCGTHVSNLSHLQAVKLLSATKGKKGKVNLNFLVGGRILRSLQVLYDREKVFNTMLKGQPEDHADLLKKIQNSLKVAQKNNTVLLRELAAMEAEKINLSTPSYFSLHKKEGDNEYMNIIANSVDQDIFLFLTTGDDLNNGLILIRGKEKEVEGVGRKISELLGGKVSEKGGKIQGKVSLLSKRKEAEKILKEFFDGNK